MNWKKLEFWLVLFLVIYSAVIGLGGAAIVAINFPTESPAGPVFPHLTEIEGKTLVQFLPFGVVGSTDQGLLLLALFAGVAGSFLHTAQSLGTYIGNADFKASWTAWYFLRPWIGAVLGFAIYFVFRAGLIGGASNVNPYGIVAIGLLGGWFSKTTSDKLQEVFETLFKTNQDELRKDKLSVERPFVENVAPNPIPADATAIVVSGRNFQDGALVQIGASELDTQFVSSAQLNVTLDGLARPAGGSEAELRVKNPQGVEPLSNSYAVKFT